jgi:hypothetical protein
VGRVRPRILLALVVVLLALPGSASAYVIGGHRWPGHRITYFNADRKLAKPVALAVRAWNTSGVRIKFVKASRHRAQVVLRSGDASRIPVVYPSSVYDNGYCAGFADVGWWPGRHQAGVTLDRDCAGLLVSAEVITHELGHILGLQHPEHGCALMTSTPYWACRRAPRMWQYRCNFFERDDLRGAIRLYGGRIRKRARFCDVYKRPTLPNDLEVELSGPLVTVTWVNPELPEPARPEFKQPLIDAALDVTPGGCPAKFALFSERGIPLRPGHLQQFYVTRPSAPGVYCFTLRERDEFGRSGVVDTEVTIPNQLPIVSFSALPMGDGTCVDTVDSSTDRDGQLVSWEWDFGAPGDADNTSANPLYATHCYTHPGTYTITLTVTDDAGGRAAGTQTVTVP